LSASRIRRYTSSVFNVTYATILVNVPYRKKIQRFAQALSKAVRTSLPTATSGLIQSIENYASGIRQIMKDFDEFESVEITTCMGKMQSTPVNSLQQYAHIALGD
jgi:hypothetical protein